MLNCFNCNHSLPAQSRFCPNCGARQPESDFVKTKENFFQVPKDIHQVKIDFINFFEEYICAVFEKKRLPRYLKELEQNPGFAALLEKQISKLVQGSYNDETAYKKVVNRNFEVLTLQFILQYGKSINEVLLNEAIIQYQWMEFSKDMIYRMTLDYLDFAHEPDILVYADLSLMPVDKLRNAWQTFLFPATNEKILIICDQTISGSFKEGFAVTENGIYWKELLSKPKFVRFFELETIRRTEDWITINGLFFNAGRSLNIKTLLFLQAIKRMIQS